jgi:ATP-dependent exoDNAse (exonuclease V) beta subunit
LDDISYHNSPTRYRQNGEYDEQLRKMFVGCTRAKEELVITGNYILKMDERKNYKVDNDFLHYAYEFCDKAWDYEYSAYREVVTREKLEKQGVGANSVMTFGSGRTAEIIARNTQRTTAPAQPIRVAETPAEERDEIR